MLALASGLGNVETRRAALNALPRVARIGTHLFHFLEYVEGVRGWGRLLRNAVGSWYNDMDAGRLAYQAVKYQSRDGWSHRDALRLAKPVPPDALHDAIYGWIANGWDEIGPECRRRRRWNCCGSTSVRSAPRPRMRFWIYRHALPDLGVRASAVAWLG